MKNSNLFPLVRNRYFFGKLLTQRDMEAEQDYFNNKRRLINLLTSGSGVVCGLGVVRVDGSAILVEPGMALDGTGRELVISEPVIARLSELNGFDGDWGAEPFVYLVAEYDETLREPVHAMTDSPLADSQFGRAEEGVRLVLSYGEPQPHEITRPAATVQERRVENLAEKLERGAGERIYLAKINLIRWGEAYEIEGIEQLPFGQYAALPASEHIPPAVAQSPLPTQPSRSGVMEGSEPSCQYTVFGTAQVEIPIGAKKGSVHYSQDIIHGLGIAGVTITLGILDEDGAVFGDSGIFGGARGYSWAAKTSDPDGTFRIGVKVNTSHPRRSLAFRWSAVADPKSTEKAPDEPMVVITPATPRIVIREAIQFKAEVTGLAGSGVIWSVSEPEGGSITEDGYYIAPASEGVFEITAQSADNPEVRAAALVVVISPEALE